MFDYWSTTLRNASAICLSVTPSVCLCLFWRSFSSFCLFVFVSPAPCHTLCLPITVSLSVCLSLSNTHTHTHTHIVALLPRHSKVRPVASSLHVYGPGALDSCDHGLTLIVLIRCREKICGLIVAAKECHIIYIMPTIA